MRLAIAAVLLSASMVSSDALPSRPKPPPGPPPEEGLEWNGWEWEKPEELPRPSEDAAKGLAITSGMIGLGLLARWLMSRRRPTSGLAPA
jgi:hypothetical protein